MKIVIAGGNSQAEFILSMYKRKGNQLVVINGDAEVAALLVKRCRVPVYHGNPWRRSVLDEAGAYDADVFISLCEKDTDNFAACMMAKRVFNAKKCICVVNNPSNVEIYRDLGIDSVLSSTYLLANSIREEMTMENLVRTLAIDDNQIIVTEFTVLSKHVLANHKIRDIHFPTTIASISAIKRGYDIIIPNGDVELLPKDVMMVVSSPSNASKVTAFLSKEVDPAGLSQLLSIAKDHDNEGE